MSDQTSSFIDRVRAAGNEKYSLMIQGGGSKSFLGRAIQPTNHIIDTREHSGIISYEPVELVMQARSGTTIDDIEQALDEKGQCLSSQPARFEGKATIGGSLAANMSGSSRPFSGSLRDHILGLGLINGMGETLQFGGQVMKNVAGYDVSRLQAGAMGTLGLVTDISFKVMPKWKFDLTYEYGCDISEALILSNQILGSEKPVSASAWYDGKLFLRFSTMESAIEKSVGQVPGAVFDADRATQLWASIREFEHDFFKLKAHERIWRISINSGAPHPAHIDGVWSFDWGGSLRFLKANESEFSLHELEDWVSRHNGQLVHFTGGDRSGEVHMGLDQTLKKIQLRLKHAFDPQGIFNPGRLYSWM